MNLLNLDASTLWWLAAAALVLAELASGTIYLLMLAPGAAAGALAAHAGASTSVQLLAAALVGGSATLLWHRRRRRAAPAHDRRLHLDVGERVQVDHWDAAGEARVRHRGSSWPARHAGPGRPLPGAHRIRAVEGNRLLLERLDDA